MSKLSAEQIFQSSQIARGLNSIYYKGANRHLDIHALKSDRRVGDIAIFQNSFGEDMFLIMLSAGYSNGSDGTHRILEKDKSIIHLKMDDVLPCECWMCERELKAQIIKIDLDDFLTEVVRIEKSNES